MSATLVVAGDLCAAGRLTEPLSSSGVGGLWAEIAEINEAADFAIVNLECPLTDRPLPVLKSGPNLWAPSRCMQGISAARFTAACLANNHIMDAGSSGLLDTLDTCHGAGMLTVGAGENAAAACAPLRVSLNGLRLVVLAVAENEFSTTSGSKPGACALEPIDNGKQISALRRESDFTLVLLHGGAEGYPLPSPQMQKRCRHFVDMGADAVICHHTHVPSAHESYQDRPIVYGLGNLLFDCPDQPVPDWFTGYLARIHVSPPDPPRLELLPYRQNPQAPSLRLLQGPDREAFFSHLAHLNSVIGDAEKLRDNWSEFCQGRREDLLASLLCLTRLESWLLDRRLLPGIRFRLSPGRIAALRNLFSCESHAESCGTLLHDMLAGRQDASRDAGFSTPSRPSEPSPRT